MKMQTEKEFNKVESLKITFPCFVAGEAKKLGDVVQVSGNDKIQLLASHRGERVETKADDKSSKK